MRVLIRPCLMLFVLLTLLTGVVYPLLVTLIAQLAFPAAANGSLIQDRGRVVGSRLIGQPFSQPQYLWGRPSATTPAYNAASSGASNLGPTNPDLVKTVAERVAALRGADPSLTGPLPGDLVTTSASGLDPDLSPAAALLQAPRLAKARGIDEAQVRQLILAQVQDRQFGLLGEPRVNVLAVNLALDKLTGDRAIPRPER